MHKSSKRAAAETEHLVDNVNTRQLNWNDLRIFLFCARGLSFRQAANKLRISSSTVVRRIERLEIALGVRLFNRLPEGVELTLEGKSLIEGARKMENGAFDILRRRVNPDNTKRGRVNISITEGLGSYWVMPKLVEFQQTYPFMMITLQCAMESADVLRLEADLAIQYVRPKTPDLMIVKLGRLHVYPFASRQYLDIYGTPTSPSDMMNHRIVDQVAPQLDDSVWASQLHVESVEGIVGVRTNASSALFYAIEKGAGIGVLPTYAAALKAQVVAVDIGFRHHLDIWLTYHRDIKKSRRNRLVIDWLKSIFDPSIYPWFRDEFIHPNELIDIVPKEAETNFGEGYFAVKPF